MNSLKFFLLCIATTLVSIKIYESEKSTNPQIKKISPRPRKCAPGESSEYGSVDNPPEKSKEGYTNWYEVFDNREKTNDKS